MPLAVENYDGYQANHDENDVIADKITQAQNGRRQARQLSP